MVANKVGGGERYEDQRGIACGVIGDERYEYNRRQGQGFGEYVFHCNAELYYTHPSAPLYSCPRREI